MMLSVKRYGNTTDDDISVEGIERAKRLARLRDGVSHCRAHNGDLRCILDAVRNIGFGTNHVHRNENGTFVPFQEEKD